MNEIDFIKARMLADSDCPKCFGRGYITKQETASNDWIDEYCECTLTSVESMYYSNNEDA